MADGKTVI